MISTGLHARRVSLPMTNYLWVFFSTGNPKSDDKMSDTYKQRGVQESTPVQAQVIPLILAQTRTGKTVAFDLPLIQLTNTKSRQTQGLLLCPTRVLCVQVT